MCKNSAQNSLMMLMGTKGGCGRTTTDALVRYNYCKVQPWEAAAPIDFCASKSLRTHLEDITQPTVSTTAAPFTMIGTGCPHPSLHNSYSISHHPIPTAPISSDEGFLAAGYHKYFLTISPLRWMRLQPLATTELPLEWVETVDLQAPVEGEAGIRPRQPVWPTGCLKTSSTIWWPTLGRASWSLMVWNRCVPNSSIAGMLPRGRASKSRIEIFRWGTAWRSRSSW